MKPPSQISGIRLASVALILFLAMQVAAVPAEDPSVPFYDPEIVQQIRLQIKPENLDRLNHALPKRITVPAVFHWKDQTIQNVGVRYKGNSSSSPDSTHKRGILIDFSEFKKKQRFLGFRHVALDNGIQFGSLFSERLITDILSDVGVKASRCNYATLYINDKYMGVYVNEERIDKSFLLQHFGNDDGTLFKVDEGGPGSDLHFIGDDPDLYRKAFELHTGRETEAYSQLLEFVRIINSPATKETELRQNLDLETFIKTTAVMLFGGAFDQYTGWGPHNYYLYRNPADHRWTYIPWDLDVGFADNAFGKIPVLDGWNAAWPAPVPDRPLMEQLVSSPTLLHEYRDQAKMILEKNFRPEILVPKLRGLYAQIQSDLANDPFPARRATNPGEKSYQDILASMETFIRKRYALAKAQLDAPGERPASQRMDQQANQSEPKPGPASADAPTDLRVVQATAGGVELRWTNHAEGAAAYIVQRSDNPRDFVNAIGQPGPAITSAIDRNVQPGKSYYYRVYALFPTPQGPRGTGVSEVIFVRIPLP